jgi:hypothetical protein
MFNGLLNLDRVKGLAAKYPKDSNISYQYGTAGFRYKSVDTVGA